MGINQSLLENRLLNMFNNKPATSALAAATMAGAIADSFVDGDNTGWTNLPLANGWVAKGNGYVTPQYRKQNGRVYLRGCLSGSSATSATFVSSMPAGFCTPAYQTWTVYAASTSARPVTIGSLGQMYTSSTYATLYLDGISYEPAPLSGWTSLTLTSSWKTTGGIYEPPAYKLVNGHLWLKGHVTRQDTNSTTITTLPVGMRPTAQMAFASYGNSTALTALIVTSDGTVSITPTRTWVYLDNVNFEVAL